MNTVAKVNLLRAAALPTIDGKSKDYNPGLHELGDLDMSHWFTRGLISSGDLIIVEEIKPYFKSFVAPTNEIEIEIIESKPEAEEIIEEKPSRKLIKRKKE